MWLLLVVLNNGYDLDLEIVKSNFKCLQFDNSVLLGQLFQIGNFTFIENPGNMGDILIAKSTIDFFDRNKLRYTMFVGRPSKVIVYGGGGFWTQDYKVYYNNLFPVFSSAKKILILPSSFFNCPDLVKILDERFVIFCREKQSYNYLLNAKTTAKIILDHDMAFRCTDHALSTKNVLFDSEARRMILRIHELLKKINGSSIARFMRRDCESAGNYETDLDLSSMFGNCNDKRLNRINLGSLIMLCVVDAFETIVTDRLHVAIAAVLMGKQVYMMDNSYGKLSSVYNHSMEYLPNVHLCKSMPNIDNLQISFSDGKSTDSFGKIVKLVKEFEEVIKKQNKNITTNTPVVKKTALSLKKTTDGKSMDRFGKIVNPVKEFGEVIKSQNKNITTNTPAVRKTTPASKKTRFSLKKKRRFF